MNQYIVKNSDLYLDHELIKEGSYITMDEREAEKLKGILFLWNAQPQSQPQPKLEPQPKPQPQTEPQLKQNSKTKKKDFKK